MHLPYGQCRFLIITEHYHSLNFIFEVYIHIVESHIQNCFLGFAIFAAIAIFILTIIGINNLL